MGVSGTEYQLLGVSRSGNRWWVCLGGQCRVMFVSWETTVGGCVWEETNSVHLVYVCLGETGLLQLVSRRVPAFSLIRRDSDHQDLGGALPSQQLVHKKRSCPMKSSQAIP